MNYNKIKASALEKLPPHGVNAAAIVKGIIVPGP